MLDTCFYFNDSVFSKSLNRPGIYGIFCVPSKKWYIGQAVKVGTRLRNHKAALRDGVHENDHLNKACQKYGIDSFLFVPLEFCDRKSLNDLEAFYIKFYNTLDNKFGYNKCVNPSVNEFSEECLRIRRHAIDNRKTSNKHLVETIRSSYPEKTAKQIASELSLDRNTISRILLNKSYPDPNYKPITTKEVVKIRVQKALEKVKPYLNSGITREEIRKLTGVSSRKMISTTKNLGAFKQSTLILNTETGIFYNTINEAASTIPGLKRYTLRYWLFENPKANKTSFILLESDRREVRDEIIILNLQNGVFHESFSEASQTYPSGSLSTLKVWLTKHPHRNQTNLQLV